ncbi:phosphotriesterase-related protein [Treponema sp. HNW]|uniref:phosphotriesterase family protein n=1 Tax=Treponema sp. HNW TaxID=3116654 RepID=UPI003D1121A9
MLLDGYTLMHEHIRIDLSKQKNNTDCLLDCKDETVAEFKKLYAKGIRNITDVTNIGMGRDVSYISSVSRATGINILCATGFYKEPFLPDYIYSYNEKQIAEIMIKEITEGIDGTDIKAQIIGEIGSSKECITDAEKKVFNAAVIAHKETGTPITTHTTLGLLGLEQIEIFKKQDIDLNKVIIGHVDLTGDISYILKIIDAGAYVEFDTIGKNNYLNDSIRIDMLKEIEKRHLIDRVLFSMDITRKSNMEYKGGIGYSYLFDSFFNELTEQGFSQTSIEKILKDNPRTYYGQTGKNT